MKIIIEYQGVKRQIEGPFEICASGADFKRLREQLSYGCMDEFIYGWVKVRTVESESAANTSPIGWKEEG